MAFFLVYSDSGWYFHRSVALPCQSLVVLVLAILSNFADTEFDDGMTDRGIKTACYGWKKGYNICGGKKGIFNCSRHSHIPIHPSGSPSRV